MADLVLDFGGRSAARLVRRFRERYPTAVVRALNRAAVSARTLMAREIGADLGLKVGTVSDAMRVQSATHAVMVARVSISGKRIPLIDFNARGRYPSQGRGRGVTARLPGGKGRYPHAFIAVMRSGHRGVFQRSATKRLPIYELRGPSLPHVFAKKLPLGLARAQESLLKNLQSELRFAISGGPSSTLPQPV